MSFLLRDSNQVIMLCDISDSSSEGLLQSDKWLFSGSCPSQQYNLMMLPLAEVLHQQPHNQWEVFSLVVGWQQNRIFVRLLPGLRIASPARHVGVYKINTGCLHQIRCPWKSIPHFFGSGANSVREKHRTMMLYNFTKVMSCNTIHNRIHLGINVKIFNLQLSSVGYTLHWEWILSCEFLRNQYCTKL